MPPIRVRWLEAVPAHFPTAFKTPIYQRRRGVSISHLNSIPFLVVILVPVLVLIFGCEPVLGQCTCTSTTTTLSCENRDYSTAQAFDRVPTCSQLTHWFLYDNQITAIPEGAFNANSVLITLDLAKNLIRFIPTGAFSGLVSLKILNLEQNRITSIPSGAFNKQSRMTELRLDSNQITAIPDKLFDACTSLWKLYLHRNKITAIPERAFAGPYSNFKLDISANLISYIHPQAFVNPYVNFCGVTLFYNPNPLLCSSRCPFSCTECNNGFVIGKNATKTNFATCYGPQFGFNSQNTVAVSKATKLKALISKTQPLYVGVPVPTESATFFEPKKNVFAGYKLSGDNIRFRLDFPPQDDTVDLGCGDIFLGDTLADGTQNLIQYKAVGYVPVQMLFDSREMHLRFEVTKSGSIFHFNGCQSEFGVSLGVYKFGDATFAMVAGRKAVTYNNAFRSSTNLGNTIIPDSETCTLSTASNLTTPPLDVGSYVVVVQGSLVGIGSSMPEGGLFELTMSCPNGMHTAAPRAPSTNPGGLTVNPSTGELSGAPQTIGSYTVNYTAIDSVGNTAVLTSWAFEVKDQPVLEITNVPFEMELTPLDGYDPAEQQLLAQLTINTTYRYFVANDRSLDDFVTGNFGSLSVRIAVSGDNVPESEVLIDTTTGTFQVQPSTTYTATVKFFAVDTFSGNTREAQLTSWTFEALPADTTTDINGPNAKGCGNGTKVDIIRYDLAFTCKCNFGFSGDNCETTKLLPQLLVEHRGPQPPDESLVAFTQPNRTQWAIGISYRIAPLEVLSASTSDGDVVDSRDIKYNLEPNPKGFFIDSSNGEILGQPGEVQASFTSTLFATAPGTTKLAVMTLQFEFLLSDTDNAIYGPTGRPCANGNAVDEVEFNTKFTCDCYAGFSGPNCDVTDALPALQIEYHGAKVDPNSTIDYTPPTTRTKWAINTTYRIAPSNINSANTSTGQAVSVDSITYTLDPNPAGFFIDGSSGEILGRPEEPTKEPFTSTLFALAPGTTKAAVVEILFEFIQADVNNPLNGPNALDCANGEGERVDIVEFDQNFTCKCFPGYGGDNCETKTTFSFTCEYGSINAQGTGCEAKDCPNGCTCDVPSGSNNFITVACSGTDIPLSRLPVGTKTVDLTMVKLSQSNRLALLKLPPAFEANSGVIKTAPLNTSSTAAALGTDSSHTVCNPSQSSWTNLAIQVCPPNSDCNITCELGTYQSENGTTCVACERGGFYSDRTGRVGEFSHCGACGQCVNGTFANTSGATNVRDCSVCPSGTNTSRFAGYRACPCLENFARMDRFGECTPCETDSGITCNNSYRALLPGYYWTFGSNESLVAYETFVANLQKEHDYDHNVSAYSGTLPSMYKCPRAASCMGGVNGSCAEGFTGPLCAVCDTGYGSSFGGCTKCASLGVNAAAISLCLLLLLGVLYWLWVRPVFKIHSNNDAHKPNENEHQWGIATVILEDHYVITSQIRVLFPFVPWRMAAAAETFLNGIRFLSQPFEGAVGMGCFTRFTVLDELLLFNIIVALVLLCVFIFYCVGRVRIRTGCYPQTRTVVQLSSISVGILCKALPTLITYVLLKATVVLRPCHLVGDTKYVYADYQVVCDSSTVWNGYRTLAFFDIAVIGLCFVGGLFFVGFHHHRKNLDESMRTSEPNSIPSDSSKLYWSTALQPVTKDYRDDRSYWRLVDFFRVVCVTSIIEVIAVDTSVQLFAAALFAVVFLQLASKYTPFLSSKAIVAKEKQPDDENSTCVDVDDDQQVMVERAMSDNNRTYTASLLSTLLIMMFAAMLESGSRDPTLPNKTSLKAFATVGLLVSALLPYIYIFVEFIFFKGTQQCKSRECKSRAESQPRSLNEVSLNPVFAETMETEGHTLNTMFDNSVPPQPTSTTTAQTSDDWEDIAQGTMESASPVKLYL